MSNQHSVRVVIDTNVLATSNGANGGAPPDCVVSSAKALQAVMESGHVFLDSLGLIVAEYRANVSATGQPGPGDAFLKWLMTNEWNEDKVTHVELTAKEDDAEDFNELPTPGGGTQYDRSDRKFLAVAAAHEDHPPILQSFDSKWWGWQSALSEIGVSIHFLCKHEIARKHAKKMG